MSNATKTRENAFAGLGDMLAGGFDAGLTSDASDQLVNLVDIEIEKQVRDEMEDEHNSLAELGSSLRKEQLQSILLRPNREGAARPYLLVAGERRVKGALLEGMTQLRARIKPLTDDEASDAQFAENIHRKNLTQIEEAKAIQRDLDQLGSVDAVLAKHNKSRAWLSKITGLLRLPEQAKRLVSESISADIEVIHQVRAIEQVDPVQAKALVDDLKRTRGKSSVRSKVSAVKDRVKPSKAKKANGADIRPERVAPAHGAAGSTAAATGTGTGTVQARAESCAEVLAGAYTAIFDSRRQPKAVESSLTPDERAAVEGLLSTFHEAGRRATDAPRVVMEGFRNGGFATDGAGAFALVAYLQGAGGRPEFDLRAVFECIRA